MYESETSSNDLLIPLYAHRKGDDWGLAIMAWERGPRRAYQFEDGRLRVFKEGYYDLLEEVDAPTDRAMRVIAELQRKLGNTAADSARAARTRPDVSFEQQLAIFGIKYPGGFADPNWIDSHRGDPDKGRQLKRHRVRAIAAAQQLLSRDENDAALEEHRASEIHAAAVELLASIDLVSAKQLDPLRQLPPTLHAAFVARLRDLLHGHDAYELRFERYVATLALVHAAGPSWQLATALPALALPDQHVCVRPSTLRKQAEWMAPRLTFTKTPHGPLCARFDEMAVAVRKELEVAGLEPADLLDVFDFMRETLAPSAKQLLVH
ncbi:MAG TPA: hypothetical protein VML75_27910 [Kofleriaceae bacterium]|nr:hypothetical protein [Kofleriaceae bacterium]